MRPFEFPHGSTALPVDAHVALNKVMRQLQASPTLRLHIAGHAQGEEEPRISSQRAQAVGAALIALGAAPARLRAKGYGLTIPLSASLRSRLRLKSDRRASVHAIGEVFTRFPLQFEPLGCEVGEKAGGMLAEVASLLDKNEKLRLSVEGHADEVSASHTDRLAATGRL